MKITGETQVVGVFGDPVAHSLSPLMHGAAFEKLGLNWVYVPFHVKPQHLGSAVEGIKAMGLRGVNVTVPHKVHVMQYLDEIDPEAQLIGAVNTIVNRDGYLVGYNTDGAGFVRSLNEEGQADPAGKNILLLGAGGAALAIGAALARAGAKRVSIANRTVQKAAAMAQAISDFVDSEPFDSEALPLDQDDPQFQQAAEQADIVVQCTSVGMYPHHDVPPIVSPDLFRPHALVADIVYVPRETSMIRAARARGCSVLTGEGMLAYQGAIALELWTGMPAPAAEMLSTLRRHLTPV